MDNMQYRIGLRKGDFQVDVQGDREWVEQKFKELVSEEFKASLPKEMKREALPETLGEFLEAKGNPQKHTDLVAVYACWLFKKEGLQSFNVKDIINCYDKTRRAKPKNTNQIINAGVYSSIFAEVNERKDGLKAWVITKAGEESVAKMK